MSSAVIFHSMQNVNDYAKMRKQTQISRGLQISRYTASDADIQTRFKKEAGILPTNQS